MDLKELFARQAPGAAPASDDPVQAARTRARRRLVGTALLLVVGIVAFPLLFETKPRPLALDTPIVAGRAVSPAPTASGSVPTSAPAVRAAPAAAPPAAASAAAEVTAPVDEAPPAESAAASAAAAPKPAPAAKPASAPAPAPAKAPPPVAAAQPPAAAASAAASTPRGARYVVQVGAFTEATAAREVRLKVEKLGLKTYTQVVDTEGGKRTRVRVGPFASREEAMQTLARIQAANLPGVVLAL